MKSDKVKKIKKITRIRIIAIGIVLVFMFSFGARLLFAITGNPLHIPRDILHTLNYIALITFVVWLSLVLYYKIRLGRWV